MADRFEVGGAVVGEMVDVEAFTSWTHDHNNGIPTMSFGITLSVNVTNLCVSVVVVGVCLTS
jgi:hypothetical protein